MFVLQKLSLVVVNGGYSYCGGFSRRGAQALGLGSVVVVYGWLLRDMWSLPGPGIELVSPALVGRFLSTMPQGKSRNT